MIPQLRINNIGISNVGIGDASTIRPIYVHGAYIPTPYVMQIADADRVWMMDPSQSVPTNAPVTDRLGRPIVEMPGCVVIHKENASGWPGPNKNMQLVNDDPKGNVAVCEAGQPAFDPIDYDPANLRNTTPPPTPDEPEANSPEPITVPASEALKTFPFHPSP